MVSKRLGWPVLLALAVGVVNSFALANARDWDIKYSLLPAFAGAEMANGRIVVQVTNLSAHPVAGLTLRLADQTQGRLTGAVQEEIDLKAGESRRVEGEFALKVDALAPGHHLDWLVVYDDPGGFARQQMVRGDTTVLPVAQGATINADSGRPGT